MATNLRINVIPFKIKNSLSHVPLAKLCICHTYITP